MFGGSVFCFAHTNTNTLRMTHVILVGVAYGPAHNVHTTDVALFRGWHAALTYTLHGTPTLSRSALHRESAGTAGAVLDGLGPYKLGYF